MMRPHALVGISQNSFVVGARTSGRAEGSVSSPLLGTTSLLAKGDGYPLPAGSAERSDDEWLTDSHLSTQSACSRLQPV
jgi:hypothetical protein